MNAGSTALIVLGLFFVGGIISFVKQGMPKGLIVLVSLGSVACLVLGFMRLEVGS
ncbi:hypothetical protein [Streptomyces odontomachi]|uniref:hypothetical protein n=1 Tax=Streptomyces odontomachi TaxID=2944940 RepID=UPI00210C5DC5|nr:hypothetical protein [Streptomyces sp. ODS25]